MATNNSLLVTAFASVTLLGACSTVPSTPATPLGYQGTGDVIEYFANGKVKRQASYVEGELVAAESFYASGAEQSSEEYRQGEIYSATYFYSSGRIKAEVVGR